jgi:hypothetical protein
MALEGAEIGRQLGVANMYGDYLDGLAAHLRVPARTLGGCRPARREVVERDQSTA